MLPFALDRWKTRNFRPCGSGPSTLLLENLDVIGAYIQNSFFGTPEVGSPPASAPSTRNAPERSTRSLPLSIGGSLQSGMSIPGSCSRK
jgi:hypothetical protein